MPRGLNLEGHGNFRIKIALSLITKKPIRITNIRHKSLKPGLDDSEVLLLKLVDEITNGTVAKINDTGTIVHFTPGTLIGGDFSFDCGNQRGLGYFVEFLLLIAPFCKSSMDANLYGVTNAVTDLSIDAINHSWLPIYRKFIGASSASSLKLEIIKRGVAPDGGGEVLLHTKPSNQINSIDQPSYGKIYRIRGIAWSCRVNSAYGQKLIAGAKSLLNKFLSDVYITIDHRKGEFAGKSPGFGITLYAESKDGTMYASEAMSEPQGENSIPVEAEELGKLAAGRLFDQIYQGGYVDNGAQSLALTLMACEGGRNASQLALGNPTEYTVATLRLIREFLGDYSLSQYPIRHGPGNFYINRAKAAFYAYRFMVQFINLIPDDHGSWMEKIFLLDFQIKHDNTIDAYVLTPVFVLPSWSKLWVLNPVLFDNNVSEFIKSLSKMLESITFYFQYKSRTNLTPASQLTTDDQTNSNHEPGQIPDTGHDTCDVDETGDILVATCFGAGLQNINKSIR